MIDIKMSDVFDLPLTSGEAFCYDAQNSSVLYMDNSSQGTKKPRAVATAKAINAYDANQKSISSLRSAVHDLAVDGIKQQGRIAELEQVLIDVANDYSEDEMRNFSPAINNAWIEGFDMLERKK